MGSGVLPEIFIRTKFGNVDRSKTYVVDGQSFSYDPASGQWMDKTNPNVAPQTPPPSSNPQPDMGSIFGAAKNYAEQTVPTGDVWANALMDSINTMGQGTLEQFNSRGQGVNSGIFTDALAKNAASMTTQSQLDQSKLLSSTMADYFTGDKAQYYDQWKTQYQGDLERELAQKRIDAYNNALAANKKSKKSNSIGSLLGAGVGALAGGLPGAQVGANIGGSAGEAWL